MALVEVTKLGLYCPQADIYIDPWRKVPRAMITHAHADHARSGMGLYIAQEHSVPLLKSRLGKIQAQGYSYGTSFYCNGVRFSFHPAGHVPGSAQIRLEYKGEVWVVSGDYKLEDDGLSVPFEPIKCHSFITESTFGMPIYRWMPQEKVFGELNDWWATNAEEGVVSVMVGYSLGKAQRILHHLDASIGPVIVHPAIHEMNDEIRAFAPQLKQATKWTKGIKPEENRNAMILIPPGAHEVHWIEKFRPYSMGFASGWMNLRGARRWNAADRGFVISDHADWPSLLRAIQDTGAEKVFVTHGYTSVLVRYLRELGLEAEELETLFEGETQEVNSAAAHE